MYDACEISFDNIWQKVVKKESSKSCGKRPLKIEMLLAAGMYGQWTPCTEWLNSP